MATDMLSKKEFEEKVNQLKKEVKELNGVDDESVIEETAQRLLGFHYGPPVYMAVEKFLHSSRNELISEIDRIIGLPEDELKTEAVEWPGEWEVKLQHISVLVFYFRELAELRLGIPEAWDEIDEIYVHD